MTGRVGYAWDRFLRYVKGVVAWEGDDHSYTDGVTTGTVSATRNGWTIGVGGEYAFTNFLSGFVEYNYYEFGSRDLTFVDNIGGTYVYGIDAAVRHRSRRNTDRRQKATSRAPGACPGFLASGTTRRFLRGILPAASDWD